MIRFLYNLLYPIGLIFFLPGQIAKLLRRGNYRHKFGQRFGFYDEAVRSRLAAQRCTWIHAVSVGEVAVALKLATKLRELDPDFFCALTTTTTTGFQVATAEPIERTEVLYSPLDFWPIMRRAFAAIRPRRIVLVEAEIWPNLAAEARNRRIPLLLVNARLSRRSEARFRRFQALIQPTFQCLDAVCIQESADVERWVALGIASERIHHVGSIKYDPEEVKLNPEIAWSVLVNLGVGPGTPILFGGSTHAGEEEILATVYQELRAEFPDLRLIIAPRHVERIREIREQLTRLGVATMLRSEVAAAGPAGDEVLLLDTTGELQNWYGVATIVFIGKSLTAHGGQNPVEPILAGKPVLFGPHMENFVTLAGALVTCGGSRQVQDPQELKREVAGLLREPSRADQLVGSAQQVLARHRGATERTARMVMKSVSASSVPVVGK